MIVNVSIVLFLLRGKGIGKLSPIHGSVISIEFQEKW
jgi:hypothetical protein